MSQFSLRKAGATLVAAIAVSIAFVACGGGDDSTGGGSSTESSASGNGGGTISIALEKVSPSVCAKVTDDRGLFKKAGITLDYQQPPASTTAAVAQILNGQVTAGFGSYTGVIAAVANDLPVVVTNSMDRDFNEEGQTSVAVVVGKDTGIKTFKDLEGKTVGINSLQGSWEVETKEAIAKEGGDPDNVKLVPVGFGDQATALASGNVDAITTAQPILGLLSAEGFESIGNPQAIMMGNDESTAGGVFMAKSFVEENEPLVKNFVDTMAEGVEYCNDPANEKFMKEEIAAFTELPQEIVDATPIPNFGVSVGASEMEKWIEGMKTYGVIPDEPSTDEVVWSGAIGDDAQ